jgi:DNA-binding NarL/FixJ family response regulator
VIRVLLVGSRLLMEALAETLRAVDGLEVVGTVCDPGQALETVQGRAVDVAVCDCATSWLDLVQLTTALHAAHANARAVVLADGFDRDALATWVRAGIVGYIAKSCALREFADALRQVHDGRVLFEPDRLVDLAAHSSQGRVVASLAPREVQVLQVLATGASTPEAAARLHITVHTLRTHLKRAMGKLRARSKLEAILIAHRVGLIDLPQ